MSSKIEERRKRIDWISAILSRYFKLKVEKDFKIDESHYVDLLGIGENNVVVVEVKSSGHKSDQSDLMQVSGYVTLVQAMDNFRDKKVDGVIISSGATGGTIPLVPDFGICITSSDKPSDIKADLSKCIPKP